MNQLPPGIWDDPKPEDMPAYNKFVETWFKNESQGSLEAQAYTTAKLPVSYSADYGSGVLAYSCDFKPLLESIEFPTTWPNGDGKDWWYWGETQTRLLLELAIDSPLAQEAVIQHYTASNAFTYNLAIDLGAGINGQIWFTRQAGENAFLKLETWITESYQVSVAMEYSWVSGTFANNNCRFEKVDEKTTVQFLDVSPDSFEEDFFIGPDVIENALYKPIGCGCESNPIAWSATVPKTLMPFESEGRGIYSIRMKIKPGADRVETTNRTINCVLNIGQIPMVADSTSVRMWYTPYASNDDDAIWEIEADPNEWHDFVLTRDHHETVKIYWDGELVWTHNDNLPIFEDSWISNNIFRARNVQATSVTSPNAVKDVSMFCSVLPAEQIKYWYDENFTAAQAIITEEPYDDCDDEYDYDYDGGGGGSHDLCESWRYYNDDFRANEVISIVDWVDEEVNTPPGSFWWPTGDGQTDPVLTGDWMDWGLHWPTLTEYTKNQFSLGYGDYIGENGISLWRGNFQIDMEPLSLDEETESPQLVGYFLRSTGKDSPFIFCGIQQIGTEPDENGRCEYQWHLREIYNNDPEDPSSTILTGNELSGGGTGGENWDGKFRWKQGDRTYVVIQDIKWTSWWSSSSFIQGTFSVFSSDATFRDGGSYRFTTNLNTPYKRLYSGIFMSARNRTIPIDAKVTDFSATTTNCWGTTVTDCCGSDLDFGFQWTPPEYGPGSINPPWYDDMWLALASIQQPATFDCESLIDGWQTLYEATNDYYIRVDFAVDEYGPKLRWILGTTDIIIEADEVTELGYTYWKFELPNILFPGTVNVTLQMACSIRGKGKITVGSAGAITSIQYNDFGKGKIELSGDSSNFMSYENTGTAAFEIGGKSESFGSYENSGLGKIQVGSALGFFSEEGKGKIQVGGNSTVRVIRYLKTIIVPPNSVDEDLTGFFLGVALKVSGIINTDALVIYDHTMKKLGSKARSYVDEKLIIFFSCNLKKFENNVFYLYEEIG